VSFTTPCGDWIWDVVGYGKEAVLLLPRAYGAKVDLRSEDRSYDYGNRQMAAEGGVGRL
jgi:hypothetical protein